MLPVQGAWVQLLVGELRPYITWCSQKIKYRKDDGDDIGIEHGLREYADSRDVCRRKNQVLMTAWMLVVDGDVTVKHNS